MVNVLGNPPSPDDASSDFSNQNEQLESLFGEASNGEMRQKIKAEMKVFDSFLDGSMNQDRKSYNFRAIPCITSSFQMSEVYLNESVPQNDLTFNSTYILSRESADEFDDIPAMKEFYVRLLPKLDDDTNSNNVCNSIEIPNMLMARMKIPKFSWVTLTSKMTVLNFFEKIELVPTREVGASEEKMILEEFKRIIVSSSEPILINQDQIFELSGGQMLITVKIFPESFRYCLCDSEILRENKIALSNQSSDLRNILKMSKEIISNYDDVNFNQNNFYVSLGNNVGIVEDCVRNIILKIGSDDKNQIKRTNNYLIIGKTLSVTQN